MIIRLFCLENIKENQQLLLDEKQSNYLCNVLRLSNDDRINVFDGKNGEFIAKIINANKKKCLLYVMNKEKDFEPSPDIWLLFAPLKKDCTDIVIQKSTELGVSKIIPVITEYTNSDKIRKDRFISQSIEASEQCRRLDVPDIDNAQLLFDVLDKWDAKRVLFFLNEKGNGNDVISVLNNNLGKAAILIGPEGGFSDVEVKKIKEYPFVRDIFLGKRILRAETAAIAALSCWQALNGDWR